MAEVKLIRVKSKLTNKSQVALWEKHPDHPKSDRFPEGGEVFIADDKEHQVAETPAVLLAIKDDRLELAGGAVQMAADRGDKPKAEK